MNSEQVKVRKFYDRLRNKKTASWLVVVILVFVLLLLCMMPVQDIFADVKSEIYIPLWIFILAGLSGFLSVYPYEFYEENQKNRPIAEELLQYHPIEAKEVKNMIIKKEVCFFLKVTTACLFIQLLATFVKYRTVSWMNIGYILIFVCIMPMLFDIVPKLIRKWVFC